MVAVQEVAKDGRKSGVDFGPGISSEPGKASQHILLMQQTDVTIDFDRSSDVRSFLMIIPDHKEP